MAGQMENFGTLVATEQLPSVLTDGAPVLIRIFFRLRSLFRLRLLGCGLRMLLFPGGEVRSRGWDLGTDFQLLTGFGLSPGAAVWKVGLHL